MYILVSYCSIVISPKAHAKVQFLLLLPCLPIPPYPHEGSIVLLASILEAYSSSVQSPIYGD